MTPQEAINNIDDVLSSDVNFDESIDYQLTSDDIDWLEKSKEALEKQIPEKPIQSTFPHFFWCPYCGSAIKKRIERSIRIIKNCPYCGRALDWGDTE